MIRAVFISIIILLFALIVGFQYSCKTESNKVRRLTYQKDTKTGICYAFYHYGNSGQFAVVPCKKVEKYLDE